MFREFKQFAMRGNVLDLAIGVIIGAAFGKIISSLVDNILMPLIGLMTGGLKFSELAITLNNTTINYGIFLQNVFDFLIVAFVVFMMVRAINRLKAPEPSSETLTKTCPYCITEVNIDASKCPNCTSQI